VTEDSLLHRHVHPSFHQQGRVTSQAFKPTPKDEKQLSAYNGDMISAEDSWNHYTQQLGFESAGAMAVTVAECSSIELPTMADGKPFPSHASIDFRACSNSQIEKKAKKLQTFATARGWRYQPEAR
jgi:hypothetical protein